MSSPPQPKNRTHQIARAICSQSCVVRCKGLLQYVAAQACRKRSVLPLSLSLSLSLCERELQDAKESCCGRLHALALGYPKLCVQHETSNVPPAALGATIA